jgi:ketosteroid isomerase-like protein
MTDASSAERGIQEIVAALEGRQRDEWKGTDEIWADHLTLWRNGTDLELSVNGAERNERMRLELRTLRRAIPDFTIASTFHVDEAESMIVEVTTWSGHTREVPGSAVEGEFYRYTACYLHSVANGRIVRVDAYDDAATARQWNELMTHTRLLTSS